MATLLKTGNGERVTLENTNAWTSTHSPRFFSDHVFTWYDEMCCLQNSESEKENMEELMAGYSPKVSFEFSAQSGSTWKKEGE